MLDSALLAALRAVHQPAAWVPLAIATRDGSPHVTPCLMGVEDDAILFSISGPVKKRSLRRDPRACFEIAPAGEFKHVICWGTVEVRTDDDAQARWERMARAAFPEGGPVDLNQRIAPDHTVLGVFTPTRWRIFRLP
jgi:general stress protein 26